MSVSFLWPGALWSLLLVPALAVAHARALARTSERSSELGPMRSADGQLADGGQRRWGRHVPIVLFLSALAVLGIGAARPVAVLGIPRSEGTVILAFDTSNSMLADDVAPSRVDAAKQLAIDFVEDRPDEIRIGVVTFSSGGLILQTPTDDDDALLDAIERVTAEGETSLGRGLFTALDAIDEEPISLEEQGADADAPIDVESLDIGYFGSAVIVVFSDGEDTSELNPLDVATLASNAGVSVYPVGIGTLEGAVIDIDGFALATALDEGVLTEVAELTDGDYVPGPGVADESDLASLFDRVDREFEVRGDETELTGIFAAGAALLLLLGAGVSMVRFGRAP